jgi:hypothetical protein
MTTDADSRVILANAIDHLADSIDHMAVASQARALPSQAQPPAPSPAGPPGGQANGKTTQQKMAGKVFAICKQNSWDMQDAMTRAAGRDLGGDSRTLSEADLRVVLDGFKEWGFG